MVEGTNQARQLPWVSEGLGESPLSLSPLETRLGPPPRGGADTVALHQSDMAELSQNSTSTWLPSEQTARSGGREEHRSGSCHWDLALDWFYPLSF